jgi:hypothetical protein
MLYVSQQQLLVPGWGLAAGGWRSSGPPWQAPTLQAECEIVLPAAHSSTVHCVQQTTLPQVTNHRVHATSNSETAYSNACCTGHTHVSRVRGLYKSPGTLGVWMVGEASRPSTAARHAYG